MNRHHQPTPQASAFAHNPAQGAYFPLSYYIGFLDFVRSHPETFNILTYDELAWNEDFDYQNNYPREHQSWRKYASRSPVKDKIHILIQHDVDSRPYRTLHLVRQEERFGIPSNVMIFNRRLDRKTLKHSGAIEYTDYDIDVPYLQHLETKGFVIGYHTNAVERAGWDIEQSADIFRYDVDALRRYFQVRYFSPHGGVPGPTGLNNRDVLIPADLSRQVRWVHNRYTPRFDGNYSDGGINNPKRDIRERDLREFVKSWKPGCRYRILVHPQYYDDNAQAAQHLTVAAWYAQIFDEFERDNHTGWEHMNLQALPALNN